MSELPLYPNETKDCADNEIAAKTWYSEGLRFKCTGCGQCCTGAPGYVWIGDDEIATMAEALKITAQEFEKKYVRQVGDRRSLLEHPRTYDCVFLVDNKCRIYNARPKQCRTFPWWKHNLQTEAEWNEASKYCEGINHPDAPLIPAAKIDEELNR